MTFTTRSWDNDVQHLMFVRASRLCLCIPHPPRTPVGSLLVTIKVYNIITFHSNSRQMSTPIPHSAWIWFCWRCDTSTVRPPNCSFTSQTIKWGVKLTDAMTCPDCFPYGETVESDWFTFNWARGVYVWCKQPWRLCVCVCVYVCVCVEHVCICVRVHVQCSSPRHNGSHIECAHDSGNMWNRLYGALAQCPPQLME